MEDASPQPQIPEVSSDAHDQRAATEPGVPAKQAVAPLTEVLIGKDLPASFAGMAAESDRITLNKFGIVALNSTMGMLQAGKAAAEADLKTERGKVDALQARLAAAEQQVAILRTQLAGERQSSSLRLVINSIGSVALGLAAYAFDKFGVGAGIVIGLIGAALILSAWLFKPKGSE